MSHIYIYGFIQIQMGLPKTPLHTIIRDDCLPLIALLLQIYYCTDDTTFHDPDLYTATIR